MEENMRRIYAQRFNKEELLDIIEEMRISQQKMDKVREEYIMGLQLENKQLKRSIETYEKLYKVRIIQ